MQHSILWLQGLCLGYHPQLLPHLPTIEARADVVVTAPDLPKALLALARLLATDAADIAQGGQHMVQSMELQVPAVDYTCTCCLDPDLLFTFSIHRTAITLLGLANGNWLHVPAATTPAILVLVVSQAVVANNQAAHASIHGVSAA